MVVVEQLVSDRAVADRELRAMLSQFPGGARRNLVGDVAERVLVAELVCHADGTATLRFITQLL